MYLFCVDFSENNLLTEQVGDFSLYNLPVLNKILIEHQIINFSSLSIIKAYLIDCNESVDLPLFDTLSIGEKEVFKELAIIDDNERFVAFRNDAYFEINSLITENCENDEFIFSKDEDRFVFLFSGKIGHLKRLYNKNIKLSDIFKQSEKYSCNHFDVNCGYVKRLDSIKSYRGLLFDILNGKTNYKPPFVAEGVYTESTVPVGDYSIIPPVYFDESVQIESGSVVGPNTVIYKNSLISDNTSIKNSVLFENVFVSSGCFVDGAVCCDNASIKRNSAVFSGSIIGADALIGEDMTLENGSVINKNVKYDKFNIYPYGNRKLFSFEEKLQGLSPDKCTLLGSAFAVVFNNPKVIVGSDGSPSSLSLKLAFMSGLIASGSECLDVGVSFKSQMFFSSKFCDCDFSVFFSGIGGTDIEIFDSNNKQLSKTQYCNLFDFCNKGKFIYNETEKYKNIRQIKGLRRMYIREITAFSEDDLPFVINIFCENKILLKTLEEILKITTKTNEKRDRFILFMNENGMNVNIKFKDKIYNQKVLERLVFFFMKKNDSVGIFESELYRTLWRFDSVFLVMAVLNIVKLTGKSLEILMKEIPSFYIKSNCVNVNCKDSEIAEKISLKFKFNHQNGAFNIKCDDGYLKVINDKNKGKIKVIASAESMAVSEELCNRFTEFLPNL